MKSYKIDMPLHLLHEHKMRVRITDINYGNHTGNQHIVGFLHDARAAWLHRHKYTELDVGGCGLILASLQINFLAESFFGDEISINLYSNTSENGRSSFEIYYRISLDSSPGKTIAEAVTRMVCFDYEKRKPVSIPPDLETLLDSYYQLEG